MLFWFEVMFYTWYLLVFDKQRVDYRKTCILYLFRLVVYYFIGCIFVNWLMSQPVYCQDDGTNDLFWKHLGCVSVPHRLGLGTYYLLLGQICFTQSLPQICFYLIYWLFGFWPQFKNCGVFNEFKIDGGYNTFNIQFTFKGDITLSKTNLQVL